MNLESVFELDGKEFTVGDLALDDMAVLVQTGRAVLLRDGGRGHKEYGYRNGVQTRIGDIDVEMWREIADVLIREKYALNTEFEGFRKWLSENSPWLRTDRERSDQALDMVLSRMAENQLWAGYVTYNREFFPERLNSTELVEVVTECCQKPGHGTKARLKFDLRGDDPRTICPHCGRFSKILSVDGDAL